MKHQDKEDFEQLEKSPNRHIDRAIRLLIADLDAKPKVVETIDSEGKVTKREVPNMSIDEKVRILNLAVNWEKVKHNISENSDNFDPSAL